VSRLPAVRTYDEDHPLLEVPPPCRASGAERLEAQERPCLTRDAFETDDNTPSNWLRPFSNAVLPVRWTNVQTAADTANEQHFRIIHPFHPLRGQALICVGSKQQRGGERQFIIRRPDGSLCLVPASWTDFLPPDPYLMIGEGRSHFRVEDLIALADLLRGIEL
jgi:hypothetical protein